MNTFLSAVAKDIYNKFPNSLDRLTIIIPNKRAKLFLDNHLSTLTNNATRWMPKYTTIDSLFEQMSNKTIADPIELICYLYKSFVLVTGKEKETLDKFFSWGEVMLNDFDDIDKNLADVDKLLANVSDLHDLTNFDFLTENQIEAIELFFKDFNEPEKIMLTELKGKFQTLWNKLREIYNDFRKNLNDKGLAYDGMLKREISEALLSLSAPNDEQKIIQQRVDDVIKSQDCFAFVGFNVLSQAELKLFKHFKDSGKALFYWDYDISYNNGKGSTTFEAGRFIADNINSLGSVFGSDSDIYNMMKQERKTINIIESPTENAQARQAGNYIDTIYSGTKDDNYIETAIVMCNEHALQPMLHSFTDSFKANNIPINITMGYPLSITPIASFVNAIIDLQMTSRNSTSWNYQQVVNILRHPYTKIMSENGETEQILRELKHNNIIYPKNDMIHKNDFLKSVFTKHNSNTASREKTAIDSFLCYFNDLIKQIGLKTYSSDSYKIESDNNFLVQLYNEALYKMHTIINKLININSSGLLNIKTETLVRLIKQLIANSNIPFHGEPAEGIQIMGVLETRCLDFKNVIMLSVNDENMPKQSSNTSFIPYFLRDIYNLTTIEKRVSLYAYYFYRLCQRAENITMMYNNTTEGLSKGEMSRFIFQLLTDKDSLFSPQTKISRQILKADNDIATYSEYTIKKTDEAVNKLYERYDLAKEDDYKKQKGQDKKMLLSPSAINTYINCPLKFYFTYVAGIRQEDEVTEEVEDSMFGTIFHACMECIYKDIFKLNTELQKADLEKLKNDDKTLYNIIDEVFAKDFFKLSDKEKIEYTGEQYLNREVIHTYIKRQLDYDSNLCPMKINAVEEEHFAEISITANGKTFNIRTGGIIDRIDEITDETGHKQKRIVDYKTSVNVQKANSIDQLFDSSKNNRPYHILQAFYYCDTICREAEEKHEKTPVVAPSLMYVKNTKKSDKIIKIDKNQISNFNDTERKDFHKNLCETITEIFSKDKDFTQTENEHNCMYCDFANFCGKTIKNDDEF